MAALQGARPVPERQLYRLFDVSFGQRLALGFAVLALFVIALVLVAFVGQHREAREQQALRQQAVLMARAVDDLGRSVLATTAALHSFHLRPSPANRQQVLDRAAQARQGIDALVAEQPGQPESGLGRFQTTLSGHLDQVEDMLARISADQSAHTGQAVTGLTVAMADAVLAFDSVQADRAAEALASASRLQGRAARSLLWGGLLILVVACSFALLVVLSIRRPAHSLLTVARALAAGDRRPALALKRWAESGLVARRNEILLLGKAFGDAADAIERRERRLSADGRVARATAAGFDREHMAAAALAAIGDGMHAEVGAIYVEPAGRRPLQAIASYGLSRDRPGIQAGLALVQQAHERRQRVVVDDLDGRSPEADARSGQTAAGGHPGPALRSAIAMPLMFQDRLHGVLLLVSRNRFDDDWLAFLEPAALQLAIGLENVASYERVQRLLDEVRERNDKIQNQNRLLLGNKNTLEQQNRRLREQSDALAEADQRKNQFLSALAHELRNPMAALSAGLEIISQRGLDHSRARAALAVVCRQSAQLGRLVDDLLDITRISRGKIVLRTEPVDLAAIVRACADDNQALIQARALQLELDLPAQPLPMEGDPARLRQVVGNLVINAIKFTHTGGRITVQARVAGEQGRQLELIVQDTGIGMSAELIGRLFQPFSQGVLPLDRSSGGLGLGLALVKSLVELHGGTVQAHSAGEGRGSRFRVCLPRVAAKADAGSPPAAIVPADANADAASVPERYAETRAAADADGAASGAAEVVAESSLHIVIIDDNADVGQMLAAMVALDGHQVSNAHTGPEGLALMARVKPDLVLCDIGLPGMDGYEVARTVRADPQLKDTLMVAVSGYAMPRDRRMALAAGFDRHESKPLTRERFRAVLSVLTPRPAA